MMHEHKQVMMPTVEDWGSWTGQDVANFVSECCGLPQYDAALRQNLTGQKLRQLAATGLLSKGLSRAGICDYEHQCRIAAAVGQLWRHSTRELEQQYVIRRKGSIKGPRRKTATSPQVGSHQEAVTPTPRSSNVRYIRPLVPSRWGLSPLQFDSDSIDGSRADPFPSSSRSTPRPWSADPADGTLSPLQKVAPVRRLRRHIASSQAEYEDMVNAEEADTGDLQTDPLVVGVRGVQQMSSSRRSPRQSVCDALAAGLVSEEELTLANRAAMTIQATFQRLAAQRVAKAKRKEKLKMQHEKATIIQAKFRGNISRMRIQALRVNRSKATLRIQAVFRGMKERQRTAQLWLEVVDQAAAIRIQKTVRGFRVRAELRRVQQEDRRSAAVTRLQAQWRGHISRRATALLHARREVQRASALRIQSEWRGRQCRKELFLQHASISAVAALRLRVRQASAVQPVRLHTTCIELQQQEFLGGEGEKGGFDLQPQVS